MASSLPQANSASPSFRIKLLEYSNSLCYKNCMKNLAALSSESGLSKERLRQLCVAGRIPGARRVGRQWFVDDHARIPDRKPGRPRAQPRKSEALGLAFPYDWSNPAIDDDALIANILSRGIFEDICRACAHYGVDRVERIAAEPMASPYSPLPRMLRNIERGFAFARAQ